MGLVKYNAHIFVTAACMWLYFSRIFPSPTSILIGTSYSTCTVATNLQESRRVLSKSQKRLLATLSKKVLWAKVAVRGVPTKKCSCQRIDSPSRTMIMRFTAGLLLLLLSSVSIIHGEFLATPEVKWSYQIPGSGTLSGRGLRKGNGVVSSGDSVFCTADDGSLHVIKPDDLEASVVVEPPIVPGASAECRSGVAIQEKDGVFQFAVYAVTFIPTSEDTPITR